MHANKLLFNSENVFTNRTPTRATFFLTFHIDLAIFSTNFIKLGRATQYE